jgi:hypothetical protein
MTKPTALFVAISMAYATAAASADHEFAIVNSSKQIIYHLYFAPIGTGRFGHDQLGEDEEDALEPGAWIKVRDLQPGAYDLKVGHADESSCVIHRVVLEFDKTLTVTNQLLESCGP